MAVYAADPWRDETKCPWLGKNQNQVPEICVTTKLSGFTFGRLPITISLKHW